MESPRFLKKRSRSKAWPSAGRCNGTHGGSASGHVGPGVSRSTLSSAYPTKDDYPKRSEVSPNRGKGGESDWKQIKAITTRSSVSVSSISVHLRVDPDARR